MRNESSTRNRRRRRRFRQLRLGARQCLRYVYIVRAALEIGVTVALSVSLVQGHASVSYMCIHQYLQYVYTLVSAIGKIVRVAPKIGDSVAISGSLVRRHASVCNMYIR